MAAPAKKSKPAETMAPRPWQAKVIIDLRLQVVPHWGWLPAVFLSPARVHVLAPRAVNHPQHPLLTRCDLKQQDATLERINLCLGHNHTQHRSLLTPHSHKDLACTTQTELSASFRTGDAKVRTKSSNRSWA